MISREMAGAKENALILRKIAIVFAIQQHNYYTNLRLLLLENAGQLEQDSRAGGAVARSDYWFGSLLRIDLHIRTRACIPVGAEQHAALGPGIEDADHIRKRQTLVLEILGNRF